MILNSESENEVDVTYINCSFDGANIDGRRIINIEGDGGHNEIYFDGWECYGPAIDVNGVISPREMPSKKMERLEKEVAELKDEVERYRKAAIGARGAAGNYL